MQTRGMRNRGALFHRARRGHRHAAVVPAVAGHSNTACKYYPVTGVSPATTVVLYSYRVQHVVARGMQSRVACATTKEEKKKKKKGGGGGGGGC